MNIWEGKRERVREREKEREEDFYTFEV